MKPLCLAAAFLLPFVSYSQSIRTLSYNSSNNVVIGATNSTNALTWSNAFTWSTNTLASATRTNLALPWSGLTNSNSSGFRGALELSAAWLTNTNVTNFRTDIGLGATWLTNTNVTNFRSAIGLGATNTVEFSTVSIGGSGQMFLQGAAGNISFYDGIDAEIVLQIPADTDPVVINGQWNDSNVRSNLGLPLSALTNTSNVTMMRALSGSTNTNHPYSGSISVVGTNNTNTLVFSNGVLQSVQ